MARNVSDRIPTAFVERIDGLLPQTQCTRCGYPTCRAYAQAIDRGEADIDQCAPGGLAGVGALARLLGREPKPLDPAYGREVPPLIAFIDEDVCIGCTKCIQACPVDAIVGAAKRMHTVIAQECTGCGLCLPPCPVDCIALPATAAIPLSRVQVLERAVHARGRFEARNARLARARAKPAAGAAPATPATAQPSRDPVKPISRAAVLAAIARGKARRAHKDPAA